MTTLGEIIEERAAELGDRVYLSFEDQEITYGDSNARANSIANSLLQMGVRKGDKVCNMMPNCPEFIYSWFGVAKIGAVEVPVNTALRGESLKHVINHCDARAIIAGARFLEQIEFVQEDLVNLQDVIVFTDGGTTDGSAPLVRFNMVPYSQLLAGSPENPRSDVGPSD
ncbi:MAG TPA: AMP-binding protein, partial [Dehalococcoidia bacterium]|nr:AMP-binding protein [Dehalococcoidia bacterium]